MATQLNNWLSIDKTSGTGNAEITLTASSYEELVDRTTSLKIQGISKNAILTVRQNAFVPPTTNAYFWAKLEEDGEIYGIVNNTIEYSFNQSTWNSFPISSSLSVPANTYVWFRNTVDLLNKEYVQDGNRFLFTKNGSVGGDSSSMGAMMEKNFQYLFAKENTTNTYLIDASELILPWDTVSNRCFYDMFRDCSKLITPPKMLPATNLEGACYIGMFDGCKSLTTAPELPATTLSVSYQDGQTYGCYQSMFGNCSSLITAPELPATTLTDRCYYYMFFNCTSLVNAPELPATTLAKECYSLMFSGCSSLKIVPKLPATTLANKCYSHMFSDCTSLMTATELPATTLANYCYSYMFNGCSSLKIAPKLPATTLAYGCYRYMFVNCTSLVNAPELPATTLADSCYSYMFKGCTNLSYIKMLATEIDDNLSPLTGWVTNVAPTGTFVKAAANTNIQIDSNSGIPIGWTVLTNEQEELKQQYFWVEFEETGGTITFEPNWIYGAESFKAGKYSDITYSFDGINWATGTTIKMNDETIVYLENKSGNLNNADLPPLGNYEWETINFDKRARVGGVIGTLSSFRNGCFYRLFEGNSYLTDASKLILPWKTMKEKCYEGMFRGCSSLTIAPKLPATTLARKCYYAMFGGCSSLIKAPELPATTLAENCYDGMFTSCISLTNAPALPATTLANYCYSFMFNGCSSLTKAPELPATTLEGACYYGMFYKCTSLTKAPVLLAKKLTYYKTGPSTFGCYNRMFYGCTSLNYIKMLSEDNIDWQYTQGWVKDVAPTGTFIKSEKSTIEIGSVDGIPTGWTVETATS